MKGQRNTLSIIVIIILFLLIKPTPANAGPITFLVKLGIFFKDAVSAVGLTDIKNGEVIINKEGQDLIEKSNYTTKLEDSVEAFQGADEQNFYKSFYARQAAMENKDSSAWKATRSGIETGISAYDTAGGLAVLPEEPHWWWKIISTGKDIYDAAKTLFSKEGKKENISTQLPAQISEAVNNAISDNQEKQPTKDQSNERQDWKEYTSQKLNFFIKYPNNWFKLNDAGIATDEYFSNNKDIDAPAYMDKDGVWLTIRAEKSSTLYEKVFSEKTGNTFKDSSGYLITKLGDMTIDGKPAVKFASEASPEVKAEGMQYGYEIVYAVQNGNSIYSITFFTLGGDKTTATKNSDTYELIATSFKYIIPVISSAKVIKPWKLVSGDPTNTCTNPTYTGEVQVRGWYEFEKTYQEEQWVLHIADEDVKILPLYDYSQKINNNFNSAVVLINAPTELEQKLKTASKDNPEIITLKGYELYCEGGPVVSVQAITVKPNDTKCFFSTGQKQIVVNLKPNEWSCWVNTPENTIYYIDPSDYNKEYQIKFSDGTIVIDPPGKDTVQFGTRRGIFQFLSTELQTITVTVSNDTYMNGEWTIIWRSNDRQSGTSEIKIEHDIRSSQFSGTGVQSFNGQNTPFTLTGEIHGNSIMANFDYKSLNDTVLYKGTINGNNGSGTWTNTLGSSGSWSIMRK